MRSRFIACVLLVAVVAVSFGANDSAAQIPDEFENLKVLPSDIGKQDLVAVMRRFAGALGMRCSGCHVGEDPNDLSTFDFASDEKKEKKVAREMMKMVDAINSDLMTKTGIEDPIRVECATCHRGVEHPQMLDDLVMKTVHEKGTEAGVEKYKMLRTKYYGSGSYDFTPGTLFSVAEQLAESGEQIDAAIAFAKLSLEYDPEEANTHLLLAQIYARKGDKAAAIASVNKALELNPDNRWAKRLLQNLQAKE